MMMNVSVCTFSLYVRFNFLFSEIKSQSRALLCFLYFLFSTVYSTS